MTIPRVFPHAAGDTEPGQDVVPDAGRMPVLVVEDNPADAFAVKRALADSRIICLRLAPSPPRGVGSNGCIQP